MRIMTDSSAMFTPEEAKKADIDLLPLSVTINGESYQEYVDLMPDELIEKINEGGVPTSSQPSPGATMELMEKYPDEDIIVLNMADGLSGTYATTMSVKNSMDHPERIHVINTMTLCGPHRYLVELAVKMRDEGKSTNDIVSAIHKHIAYTKSFLIPADFAYLKRGGRLTPMAAKLSGLLKIVPILTLSEDDRSLEKFAVKKTWKGALKAVIKGFREAGVDASYKFYVTHAGVYDEAVSFRDTLLAAFPKADIEIIELSPVFITHGGPGCISLQAIQE